MEALVNSLNSLRENKPEDPVNSLNSYNSLNSLRENKPEDPVNSLNSYNSLNSLRENKITMIRRFSNGSLKQN